MPLEPFSLKVPAKLDRETQRVVTNAYKCAVADLGTEEESYVKKKLPRVVARLRAQGDWLESMAVLAEALAVAYFDESDSDKRMQHEGRRHILGALFYLCDPYDIIPDFDPQLGYVDDALVMNRCLSVLRSDWDTLYRSVTKYGARGRR